MTDYEMLFSPGGLIPVNVETTGMLIREVQRLQTENWQLRQFLNTSQDCKGRDNAKIYHGP